DGRYPKAAADLARTADYAIVFATQWMSEEQDAPDLSLPSGQEQLIEAVSKANPRTIVVLEAGGPVIMPWLYRVAAVLEAWYPGARGGEAIANVLFGDINPSGRLPISFPMSETQLPRPNIVGTDPSADTPIVVDYNEGASVGYRWYTSTRQEPLFSFGFGRTAGLSDKCGWGAKDTFDRLGETLPRSRPNSPRHGHCRSEAASRFRHDRACLATGPWDLRSRGQQFVRYSYAPSDRKPRRTND